MASPVMRVTFSILLISTHKGLGGLPQNIQTHYRPWLRSSLVPELLPLPLFLLASSTCLPLKVAKTCLVAVATLGLLHETRKSC